ncbi:MULTISPECIES: aspartate/glutamate racemase family protein [unclassified Rhizobium]|uniref:aspartate/glutamate racemase family protein n=1 Tax=unclassified Rhizobium TaxID=2613769 RepID=UPI0006F62FB4|nr:MULTISPECIES: aspartate/glutamate racemase family protein [unclassified Rhizobium]KQV39373.1 hypothetical protein ASC86_22830 [Rhizobium sp. Root1212]KRD35378.1 hypothetical protein ASE37_21400 [Rhizobium sp. Root268]
MSVRINYINPFGNNETNALIESSLAPFVASGTEVVFTSTPEVPERRDPYFSEYLVVKAVEAAAAEGFDGVIIGCCYDPGVRVARGKVDIPVVGALEACLQLAPFYGRDFAIVTDYHQAASFMADLIAVNGTNRCRELTAIDMHTPEMLRDPASAGEKAVGLASKLIQDDAIEAVVIACTMVGACVETWLRENPESRALPLIDPNVSALQITESLISLRRNGAYSVGRRGYYGKSDTLSKVR